MSRFVAEKTAAIVETASRETLSEGRRRGHLGASQLGDSCHRKIWFAFRWANAGEAFSGRMLRLFNRGHEEEPRIIRWLKAAGLKIWDTDPATGKQWRFSDCRGHFGGSADGICDHIPEVPEEAGPSLLEFKTHNDKSFTKLKNDGVLRSKPGHYVQMQLYMRYLGLKHGLYSAVNKNNDELYFEVIKASATMAERYKTLARSIIFDQDVPTREAETPGWWKCRFCAFAGICHKGEVPDINCRTCAHSTPVDNGEWRCEVFGASIPRETAESGCSSHIFDPRLIRGMQLLDMDKGRRWIRIRIVATGYDMTLGPDHITSEQLKSYGRIPV